MEINNLICVLNRDIELKIGVLQPWFVLYQSWSQSWRPNWNWSWRSRRGIAINRKVANTNCLPLFTTQSGQLAKVKLYRGRCSIVQLWFRLAGYVIFRSIYFTLWHPIKLQTNQQYSQNQDSQTMGIWDTIRCISIHILVPCAPFL